MEDQQIIALFWMRSETAVSETQAKYGRYCHYIAYNILRNTEDAEECVNDALMKAWNAIPPGKPGRFAAFLGKITRNLALDRYEKQNAKKRGFGQAPLLLEELEECLSHTNGDSNLTDSIALRDALTTFLWSLPAETRKIFMRRYWYMNTIKEIASDFGIRESKVKMTLFRTRNRLKEFLEKEGFEE